MRGSPAPRSPLLPIAREPINAGEAVCGLPESEGIAGDPRLELEAEAMAPRAGQIDQAVEALAGNACDAAADVLAGDRVRDRPAVEQYADLVGPGGRAHHQEDL